jgi:hypothetical protein
MPKGGTFSHRKGINKTLPILITTSKCSIPKISYRLVDERIGPVRDLALDGHFDDIQDSLELEFELPSFRLEIFC